jgi:hypothetical protein
MMELLADHGILDVAEGGDAVPAPMRQFFSTQLAPTLDTPSPSSTRPSNTQLTSIARRARTAARRARRCAPGRASVTPAVIRQRRHCAGARAPAASCSLLFTPSVSQAASGCAVATGMPSPTAMATMSVR